MSERKLLVGPDPTGATFAAGFRSAAKLPTEEQTKQAMEQTFAEMRKELHRPEYQPPSFGGPHVAGRNGWLNEQPLVNADTDRANELIEGICNAGLPQPKPRVNIEALKAFEPSVVRAKVGKRADNARAS
jgi:hypothetical protein